MRLVSILLACALLVPALATAEEPPALEKAPDFSLSDTEGQSHTLGDFLGEKVIVLSFWATWCAPCKKEMPHLAELQKELGDKGLQVLSVSVDAAKDEARVKATVRQLRYEPLVLLDSETKVVNQYNPRKDMPYTVIIGKDKRIHHRKKGFTSGDEEMIKKWVEELL